MAQYPHTWYRIGVFGDPCHDWKTTILTINAFRHFHKIPIIITKHWIKTFRWLDRRIKEIFYDYQYFNKRYGYRP